MNGRNVAYVAVGLLVVIVLFAIFSPRSPKVIVPESGPAIVQEQVPTDPEQRLAFDRSKAASACRVAILQSAPEPGKMAFGESLEDTPAVSEPNGDFSLTLTVNTSTGPDATSRKVHCRARQEGTDFSIVELNDLPA